MRWRILAVALLLVLAGSAVPAVAGPSLAHVRFGWGIGWGWGWPWWWGGSVHYRPVPAGMARTDLAAVSTDVEPEHARVYLDGELIGVADDFDGTPSYLFLKPGHYKLEFRLGGYKTESMEINAQPGQQYPVNFKLARIPGEKATPWYDRPKGLPVARVFAPRSGGAVAPAGAAPDSGPRPELRGSGPGVAQGPAVARGAALEFRVAPPNAAVYVDGDLVGSGAELSRLERGLAVTPGHHRLEVVAPNHETKVLEIDVKEGERQQIVIELEEGLDKTPGRT